MNKAQVRKAVPIEFDRIYMMGFDVWGNGVEADYLAACQTSTKYKKGTWYVLENGSQLMSSLIVYNLGENQFGIGSIATANSMRKRGHASQLLSEVLAKIEDQLDDVTFFLYSDINPEFYEKFKFVRLPSVVQRYKTTTCMIRGENIENFLLGRLTLPEYF